MTCQAIQNTSGATGALPVDSDALPVGLASVTRDGRLISANALAREWLALVAPSKTTNLFDALALAVPDARGGFSKLHPGERAVRSLRSCDGKSIEITVIGGADDQLSVVMLDDTARVRAEEDAHCHRAQFAILADLAEDCAAFTVDPAGRVARWSRSAHRFEGLSAAEATGMTLGALFARAHLHIDPHRLLGASARTGTAQLSGLRLAPMGGLRWVRVTLGAIRATDGSLEGHVVRIDEPGQDTAREAELRRLAESDPLTGVLNRRAFDEAATAACAMARARGQAFAVIAFDLDAFKLLNDRHGHATGDAALRALVDAARADVRAGDLIGRLGGDEFAIGLPRAGADLAERIGNRLRRTVARIVLHTDGAPRFTASFGIAASSNPDEGFAETLARADAALYRAKEAGRDRVVVA